jgi:hypothetical protein
MPLFTIPHLAGTQLYNWQREQKTPQGSLHLFIRRQPAKLERLLKLPQPLLHFIPAAAHLQVPQIVPHKMM